MLHDVRFAFRLLRVRTSMAVLVVGMLAVGVAASAIVFTLMDAILWHPMPLSATDRVVRLRAAVKPGEVNPLAGLVSGGEGSAQQVFDGVYAYGLTAATVNVEGKSDAVTIGEWSPGLLKALQVRPMWGRDFTAEEFSSPAPVVVLSGGLWNSLSHGAGAAEPFVVLDGVRHVVVGAMPVDFEFPVGRVALWRPLRGVSSANRLTVIGFLKPGISFETAKAFIGTLQPADAPANAQPAIAIAPFVSVPAATMSALRMLLGAALMLLLIAAANAANVLVTDGIRRQSEIAIKMSIGASRGHLLRQTLIEAVVLSGMAAGVGLLLAGWTLYGVASQVPYLMAFQSLRAIHLDWRGVGVGLLVGLVTGTVGSVLALVRSFAIDTQQTLRGQSAVGSVQARWRTLLLAAQLAVTVCLLTTAGLLTNSYLRLARTSPGFDVSGLTVLRLDLPAWRFKTDAERRVALEALRAEVAALPGVEGVTLANGTPPYLSARSTSGLETMNFKVPESAGMTAFAQVEEQYFSTVGIPIVAGRSFDSDALRAEPVVIVSRALADRLWPNNEPLGQRFRDSPSAPWRTVIGVAANVRNGTVERPVGDLAYYTPLLQDARFSVSGLVVRSRGDAEKTIVTVQSAAARLLPDAPVLDVMSGEDATSLVSDRFRFFTNVVVALTTSAFFLALMGVYGSAWYNVRQRTPEIGIRIALGASSRAVHSLIMLSTGHAIVLGLAVGLPTALVVARGLKGMLFGVTTNDPATFVVVSAVLVAAAALASYVPARRAALIDPTQALRAQ